MSLAISCVRRLAPRVSHCLLCNQEWTPRLESQGNIFETPAHRSTYAKRYCYLQPGATMRSISGTCCCLVTLLAHLMLLMSKLGHSVTHVMLLISQPFIAHDLIVAELRDANTHSAKRTRRRFCIFLRRSLLDANTHSPKTHQRLLFGLETRTRL